MKLLVFTFAICVSGFAGACPQLEGQYDCQDNVQVHIEKISDTEFKINGDLHVADAQVRAYSAPDAKIFRKLECQDDLMIRSKRQELSNGTGWDYTYVYKLESADQLSYAMDGYVISGKNRRDPVGFARICKRQ